MGSTTSLFFTTHTPKSMTDMLTLGLPGFSYPDLYDPARLGDLTLAFDAEVKSANPELFAEFERYRESQGVGMQPEEVSDLLVRMALELGGFVARLFGVEGGRAAQIAAIRAEFDTVFAYRNEVVAKSASRYKGEDPANWDLVELKKHFDLLVELAVDEDLLAADREAAIAGFAVALKQASEGDGNGLGPVLRGRLIAHPDASAVFDSLLSGDDDALAAGLFDLACRWTFAAGRLPEFQAEVTGWASFKTPAKTDFNHLVHHDAKEFDGVGVWTGPEEHHRRRDGFGLTDKRFGQRRTLYEVDHCIYCHDRDTDSCSKGMRNKKDGSYKTNPLGVTITGCPLEEKISEMHLVKRQGDNIGSLALITIDNPLCPGTGHRICNDCMKGCIYQKTEPVNIPQIETNVLTDVLFMPWGFEIYSLLTRWNPLNIKRPSALPYNGRNVMVAGMGPAGYTLSHYLVNEGFGVVGIDGLKIEPLPKALTGDATTPPQPIRDFRDLYEDLDKRIMLGFGGVAEYGITVRWDKNFLKVIYLNLLRRHNFRIYGGVRFGGTLTINEAWDLWRRSRLR